jgi:arginyl-tRNA synthetase
MRQELSDLLKISVSALIEEGVISVDVPADIYIERTRQRDHGDFACNIAMILAKSARMKPRDLANLLLSRLPQNTLIDRTEVAGPGFINIFLTHDAFYKLIPVVRKTGDS